MGGAVLIFILYVAIVAYLISSSAKDAAKTDNPVPANNSGKPTYAKRGAFIHYVVGRRQTGPIVCWVGERSSSFVDATTAGGSGGGGAGSSTPTPQVEVFEESSWHVIALGPARKLWGIYANGEKIFTGPITPQTHPSGSQLDLGNDGEMVIFWGEKNQPGSSYLQSRLHNEFNVESRFPFLFSILWKPKKLGQNQQWPSLEYDYEIGPYNSKLTRTKPWIKSLLTESNDSFDIDSHTDGPPGVAMWQLNGNKKKKFKEAEFIKIQGNSADGTYEILDVVYAKGPDKTRVFLNDTLAGANNVGQLIVMKTIKGGGANPAHVIGHVLFNRFPHGIGRDPEDYDMNSLEELGEILEGEGAACSIHGKDGQDLKGILESLFTDFGIMCGLAGDTYRFTAIREPDPGNLPHLGPDILTLPIPEISGSLDSTNKTSRIVFEYTNMSRRGKDGTVTIDDDSIASILDFKKQERLRIDTAVHHLVVSQIAQRRAPELMALNTAVKLAGNRGARQIWPGKAFTAETIDQILICITVQPGLLTGKADLEAMIDTYGVKPTTFSDSEEDYPDIPDGDEPEGDPKALMLEAPPEFRMSRPPSVALLRIRAHNKIRGVTQFISGDGATYRNMGFQNLYHFGGPLAEDLPASSPYLLEEGPTITITGPDIVKVVDLSMDEENWRLGRQLAVFQRADGKVEICFLRAITILSATECRLDGLIRARHQTEKLDLSTGVDWVFIAQRDTIIPMNDLLMRPGATLHMKLLPQTQVSMEMAEADDHVFTLRGRGIVPDNTSRPFIKAPFPGSPAFASGDDLEFGVLYSSLGNYPGTAAGTQPGGFPHGSAPIDGVLVWRLRLLDNTLVKEVTTTVPVLEILNSDLVTWFSGEPSAFRLGVANARAGFYSTEQSIDITRLP